MAAYMENGLLAFRRWKFFLPNVVLQMLNLVARIAIFFIMAQYVGPHAAPFLEQYGGSYATFIIIGVLFELVLRTAITVFYNAYAEGYWGSHIEMYLLAPVGITAMLAGHATYQYIWALFQVAAYVLLGIWLFGLSMAGVNLLAIMAVLGSAILAVTGLGLIAASTFTLLNSKNWGDPISWLTMFLASLLAGVYFPVEVLPRWLQTVAAVLPHTYAFRAGRLVLMNHATLRDQAVLADIRMLLIMSTILLPLGVFLFKKSLYKARFWEISPGGTKKKHLHPI
jgi:ABC-2 type transport system permease protein